MPHPPVVVPSVGKGRELQASATIDACRAVGRRIAEFAPETIVLISPHAPLFSDYVFVYDAPSLQGSLARFGASSVTYGVAEDEAFVAELGRAFAAEGITGGTPSPRDLERLGIDCELDHGALVPLYFILSEYAKFRLVCLSPSDFDVSTTMRVGSIIARVARGLGRRACVVASADLSHKVTAESPYGMVPEGALFDHEVAEALRQGRPDRILRVDPPLRTAAAECGYTSIVMMLGSLGVGDGAPVSTELLSYEAPFGIGYCVARVERTVEEGAALGDRDSDLAAGDGFSADSPVKRRAMTPTVSWQATLASEVIESVVRSGKIPPVTPRGERPAGCFVSIKKNGDLRGCIGTVAATTASLEEEIARNAVAACTEDPRFPPVATDELPSLSVSVDVLGPSEPVSEFADLDPKKYGVIVTSGFRRGLLLPDLEGVDTVEAQIGIACRKGGIDPKGKISVERFTVDRFR